MKKNLLLLVLSLTLSLTFVGCSDDDSSDSKGEKALVAILKEGDIDYWKQVADAFETECTARGYKALIFFSKDEVNSAIQVQAVKNVEKSGYDVQGIAFAPIWTEDDHSAEKAVADYAKANNIPVVIVDSPIDDQTSPLKDIYHSYVGTDNVQAGKDIAKRTNATAKSILVIYDEGSTPVAARLEGIQAVKGEVNSWGTNPEGIKYLAAKINECELANNKKITDIIFLNGHLCKAALPELGIYNVYAFDIYNEYAPLLDEETFMKGVLAQNTLEMGKQSVNELLSETKVVMDKHYIPTVYLDTESLKNPSDDAKPLLKYLQDNSPFKGKSVLLALGTKSYPFWTQICSGAQEKATALNVTVTAVYGETDADVETIPNAIRNCASIPNLIGVAGQITKKELDDACASIPDKVNLTLIEGVCYKGGVSENRYNGIVSLNNAHYAQEFLSHIPSNNFIVISYSSGNNVALTEEYIKLKGEKNIRAIYLDDVANTLDSLKTLTAELDKYEDIAIIFNSGNFVNAECMEFLKGRNIYSSDLNENVAKYIRTGEIKLNISPDTFKFGRLALLSALTGASYEVPYILTNKDNIDTPERTKYLK